MSPGRIDRIHCLRIALAGCTLSLFGVLSGCGGSSDPFAYVLATGKVTYADGTPIPAAHVRLTFIPQGAADVDEKTHPPKGKTDVTNKDGSFDYVTSHNYGDGLLPGKHKVIVQALDEKEQPLDNLIPAKYRDQGTTPLMIDTANMPLVILVEKPAPGAARPGGPSGNPGGMPTRRP